jgi:hypothetical protein
MVSATDTRYASRGANCSARWAALARTSASTRSVPMRPAPNEAATNGIDRNPRARRRVAPHRFGSSHDSRARRARADFEPS